MKRNLRLPLFTGLVAIAAVTVFLVSRPAGEPVAVAIVDRGPVEEVIRASGRTHVRKRYLVRVPLDAYLPPLPWHAGDRVRAGEVLLQVQPAQDVAFDPLAHEAALAAAARAQAALETVQTTAEAARTHAEFAEAEYVRLEQAFAAGDVTWKDLQLAEQVLKEARAQLRAVEFSIDVARHELDAANLRADYTRAELPPAGFVAVRAPLGGVVLSVPRNDTSSDGRVAAGAPLLELGDPATLEIRADVSMIDAARLEPGVDARISRWSDASDAPLEGRVLRIEPAAFAETAARGADEQRARVVIEITSPRTQWANLADDRPIDLELIAWRAAHVVRVPARALYRQEDRWMVLRIRGERAYGAPVVTGHHGEQYVEVLDGLAVGDRLVLAPEGVADGARVAIAR